jgi:hypothetical protein
MDMTGTRTRCALVLTVAVLALAGCASTAQTGGSAPAPAPSNTSGCPMTLTITADSTGKTLCVGVGGTVTVNLSSPDGTRWTAPELSGTSLVDTGSGPSTAPGGQALTFTAASPGTAVITSSHPTCPPATGTRVSCMSIMAWKVTVDVKS